MHRALACLIALFTFSTTTTAQPAAPVRPKPAGIQACGCTFAGDLRANEVKPTAEQLERWVRDAASMVESYYGKFPVAAVDLSIVPTGSDGVDFGQAFFGTPPSIKVRLGRRCEAKALHSDWVLVHEMIHLAFPWVPQKWIKEGTATYVEPFLRLEAGRITAEELWARFVERMPYGLAESGDQGLDLTVTWGRTYWGGALFCLMADLEIRKRTGGKRSLRDALRRIVARGGTLQSEWGLVRALRIGDEATGTTVLTDLYHQWATGPVAVDLEALWKQLGVEKTAEGIQLNNDAPLAATRRALEKWNARP